YAHITYTRQLALKAEVIADAFARIGRLPLPGPVAIQASPHEEGYRMRARLHVRGTGIGFFREGSHELCDARQTRQLLPATCDLLERLWDALGSSRLREVELAENVDASDRVVHLAMVSPPTGSALGALSGLEGLSGVTAAGWPAAGGEGRV